MTTNAAFDRLLDELKRIGVDAQQSPTQDPNYKSFIQHFPANELPNLSLEEYCIGRGDGESFCWWLERGLEPLLGRYSPGTSRGHVIYFAKDGSVYKHRRLKDLGDEDALRYTLRIHAAIAAADLSQDLRWIDDDRQIYLRVGVEPRVTVGEGRKLRLLAVYHPDEVLPINSSEHLGHFLSALGCPANDVPPRNAPVARMLKLMEYFHLARKEVPGITPLGFMKALYSPALGLAPRRDADVVLNHFLAVPHLTTRLQSFGQTDAFCQLAQALHEAGLDWWVTSDAVIHAGRTDDPDEEQTITVLELETTEKGLRVRLNASDTDGGDTSWQILDGEVAARVADETAGDTRIPVLTERDACWPDDYDGSDTTLVVRLTGGAVRNGYIKVPKFQALFPKNFIAPDEKSPVDMFKLELPDGQQIDTCVLGNRNRLKARFNGLFNQMRVNEGDKAVIQKTGDAIYSLSINSHEQTNEVVAAPIPLPKDKVQGGAKKMNQEPLNQILYGPPGTGKTYATIDRTLAILDPDFLRSYEGQNTVAARAVLKQRFDELTQKQRVRFTTFHQSFSYEDFVEGIRAHASDDEDGVPSVASGVRYRVEPGVFVQICLDAKRNRWQESTTGISDGARVWKLSIEEASSSGETRDFCLKHGEARIGWPHVGDLKTANLNDKSLKLGEKERQSLENFSQEIAIGDVVVCLASKTSISAVGVVTGEYEYTNPVPPGVRNDYVHRLPVKWLATGLDFNIVPLNGGKQLTLQTVYPLSRIAWPDLFEALVAANVKLSGMPSTATGEKEPYVLIIDEINRGNVSRIFGELITLIEPSKRMGAPEALSAILPYSKKSFAVPDNVYLIGTMNTADRSLAGLDVALRRRFDFKEMLPRPELLEGVKVAGISISDLLRVMNQRIEALLDREHVLGHAYFMSLQEQPTLVELASIFRNKVLPLMQEYFFDDWQRIQWVLNDHRKNSEHQFIQSQNLGLKSLFGDDVTVSEHRSGWKINDRAFNLVESYLGVIKVGSVA